MKQQKIVLSFRYVLSSSENMLDAVPGTLMLTECLDQCRNNDSCSSVNYETGLCVLFSTDADKLPGMVLDVHSILLLSRESENVDSNFVKVNFKSTFRFAEREWNGNCNWRTSWYVKTYFMKLMSNWSKPCGGFEERDCTGKMSQELSI